ncbi:MAG: hypothetical protein WC441_00950 [Patescibacteria group bacterium]
MKKKTNVVVNPFWPNPESLSRINIVNPQDFSLPSIISTIKKSGLLPDSFGLTNPREIRLRNEISRFLLQSPGAREKIDKWLEAAKNFNGLPNNEDEFLRIYGQENNPYWEMVESIILELDSPDSPARIKGWAEKLKAEKAILSETEKAMAARISKKLESVTEMEGILEFNPFVYNSEADMFIRGRKAYSAKWSSGYKVNAPEWTKNLFCRLTGIKKLATKIKTETVRMNAYRSAAVLHFPSCLETDIKSGVRSLLTPPTDWRDMSEEISESDRKKRDKLRKEIIDLNRSLETSGLIMTIYFRYDSHGLTIRVIGLKNNVRNASFELHYRNFDGYTDKEKKIAASIEAKMSEKLSHVREMYGVLPFYEKMQKRFELFNRTIRIPSTMTDSEFKWYAISNLYHLKENVFSYKHLLNQRMALKQSLQQLSDLNRVIEIFIKKSEELSIPLCVPEIRDSGKIGVSFNGLAPINMMGQNKKMIPFDLPTINGQMICLTGRHGGGKSVTGKSVIENIYLAQSGLPVFAKSFSLDVKTVLGSVTNDEGEGSTATVFVNKVKNLLEEIHKVPKEQSLVFIDEIGKGTQEDAGFRLGKMILSVLQGKQFSVIFNTQIMGLAEYAKDNLGALCLKVDKNHRFSEGIGDGQMDELIKESGLDHFLVKN